MQSPRVKFSHDFEAKTGGAVADISGSAIREKAYRAEGHTDGIISIGCLSESELLARRWLRNFQAKRACVHHCEERFCMLLADVEESTMRVLCTRQKVEPTRTAKLIFPFKGAERSEFH